MVSSQLLPSVRKDSRRKPIQRHMLLPVNPPDVSSEQLVFDFSSEQVELDFSDVFGPPSIHASNEVSNRKSGEVNELVYDDPEVIYNRSHSLVGPSACVSQSLKLSGLTIHETEEQIEFLDSVINVTSKKGLDTTVDDSVSEVCDNMMETHTVGLEDFEVLKVVGQGAFGKVYQVRKRGTSEIYAMKVMRKDKIMEKNHAEYMKAERDILTKTDHPFIVQLRYSFQTKYRLYLVLDFINGGHLFFQLYHHGLFREDLARVYTAEIVSAVSHLHANGIMHRDLKPENILLDVDGHALLTDFGLAKELEENARSNSLCGTVEYMSPEIILGKGHDKAADWWSVGVLLFEMLTGKPPFVGGNREKIQQKIIKDKVKLPGFLSSEAHSLLKGLLQKEPSKRLGSGPKGSDEIKSHKWLKSINWKKLEAREITPSFRPAVGGELCIANFDTQYTEMPLSDSPASSPKVDGNHFLGFSYVRPASSFLKGNRNI
ncbi:serine/threonine protein kinase 2 [Perilla frutescens var. hirtella]|uniref:non-specific serine/threonine protein kinase n=1 Tax=Perilla frutescens var. hirtella TaxID=608512 RepID=A0AAD4J0M9_PERFH|nr:serine/threonine protein kinase 2 [Perilla frutescens var. hirtella]KAH6806807.1 serine/threonine protein kinase 2 [Perilla frutescens var. frutescens]KAH6824734.1 serine/threonine protein kinase 2 [Perilla frutescens var. hirtella]